jgi:transcriptional regulator GlxA family with amidase domain
MRRPLTVAIVVFDDVETLDFAAPFEVFSLGGTRIVPGSLDVVTVGWKPTVRAYNGLTVLPTIVGPPDRDVDVLVLPGGLGVEPTLAKEPELVRWILTAAGAASWVMSICSGALFLASAGLLRGRSANTHPSDYEALRRMDPSVHIAHEKRFVRDGKYVTSAGISAGIDSSLYLLSELVGGDAARRTAEWMEYRSHEWMAT